jgi:uncharacterized protein
MDDPRIPPTDPDAAPFFEGCREGVLRIQQCAETGRLIFPPRPMSPFAPHVTPTWTTVSGRGTIWSFVVPHPPLLAPFSDLAPYVVIAVALDEDPCVRLIGNLVSGVGGPINQFGADAVTIGARVHAVFERIDDQVTLPRWVLG